MLEPSAALRRTASDPFVIGAFEFNLCVWWMEFVRQINRLPWSAVAIFIRIAFDTRLHCAVNLYFMIDHVAEVLVFGALFRVRPYHCNCANIDWWTITISHTNNDHSHVHSIFRRLIDTFRSELFKFGCQSALPLPLTMHRLKVSIPFNCECNCLKMDAACQSNAMLNSYQWSPEVASIRRWKLSSSDVDVIKYLDSCASNESCHHRIGHITIRLIFPSVSRFSSFAINKR